ncbi:hypothetical protein QCA50_004052 [Cerrena zonata]|uniref:Uncharacterized protein n=1 Tax=Cerrena zonata TaxID=2478898 RepID=A0AAW0GR27_9APHY
MKSQYAFSHFLTSFPGTPCGVPRTHCTRLLCMPSSRHSFPRLLVQDAPSRNRSVQQPQYLLTTPSPTLSAHPTPPNPLSEPQSSLFPLFLMVAAALKSPSHLPLINQSPVACPGAAFSFSSTLSAYNFKFAFLTPRPAQFSAGPSFLVAGPNYQYHSWTLPANSNSRPFGCVSGSVIGLRHPKQLPLDLSNKLPKRVF